MIRKLFLIFVCMWLLCGCASAKDYYFSPNGSGTEYTLANPGDPSVGDALLQAGDIGYFLEGDYFGKQIDITHSGTTESPITLKNYNGASVVINGDDNTLIYGIRARNQHHIVIDGIDVRGYKTGIILEYTAYHMEIKNCTVSNCTRSGIELSAYSDREVHDVSIHDCVLTWIGPLESTDSTAIYYFNTATITPAYNISIYNITINNIQGNGIGWRGTEGLHIYNVTIMNTYAVNGVWNTPGTDGIILGPKTHNPIIEDFYINNTGWHGIGLQAGIYTTVTPDLYVTNATLKNGYIGYPGHNGIDVHTGNSGHNISDIVIEGVPESVTAINYMWNGSGINVSNITATGFNNGLYLTQNNAVVDNFTTSNIDNYPVEIGGVNNKINNCNLLGSNFSYAVLTDQHQSGFMMNNTSLGGKSVWLTVGGGTISNHRDQFFLITCEADTFANVEYVDGRVFNSNLGTPVYAHTGSSLNVTSTRTITAYNYSALPESGTASITPHAPINSELANFTASSTNGNSVLFTVFELTPGNYYKVNQDGTQLSQLKAGADGEISWSNSAWSEHTYTVEDTGLRLPVAAFTANTTGGTAPATIQFWDNSTQSPTSWSWDFNGDSIEDSTEQNPVWTYDTDGSYDVSLTVTNAIGSDTETKTGYIILDNPPYVPIILTTVAAALLFMRARRRW